MYTLTMNCIFLSSCAIHEELCDLFCQEEATLDLCNVRSIGNLKSDLTFWQIHTQQHDTQWNVIQQKHTQYNKN